MNPKFATGLDVLIDQQPDLFKGQSVALVSHPAAVTQDLGDNIQALLDNGVRLVAFFGPEHGFSSAVGDGVHIQDSFEPRTGLPLYSLYGETLEPTAEMLQGIDVLIFDLQDVGARFYTYLSTLYYLLRAAGRHHCPLLVLDRPNPVTGLRIEGPALEPSFESYVGIIPIPVRHGMTLGELALFINAECGFDAELTILPMHGWRRHHWFDHTGRLWVPTSPGIPRFETTLVYPGICLLEGTNLSEGRGTSLPFEIIGAPWVNSYHLADRLNQKGISGMFARPASFTPTTSKNQGQICHGLQLHVLDRESFAPLHAALQIIITCQELFPDHFEFLPPATSTDPHSHFDLLAGTDKLRRDIQSGRSVDEITAGWESDLEDFSQRRRPYLRYD